MQATTIHMLIFLAVATTTTALVIQDANHNLVANLTKIGGKRDLGYYYGVTGCPADKAAGFRGYPGQGETHSIPSAVSVYTFLDMYAYADENCRSDNWVAAHHGACISIPGMKINCVRTIWV